MLSARKLALLCVLAAVGAMLSSVVWSAPADIKIAVVDITRIRKDSPRLKQYDANFAKIQSELQAELDIRGSHLLLDEAKIKAYIALKQKGQTATDADNAAMKATDAEQAALDTELKTLQQTPTPDDTQKARQKALMDTLQKNKATAEMFVKDSQGILQGKGDELSAKIEADILTAVKEAAIARSFTYVYDKGALLYGGTDLTDDVIKRLPSKAD